MLKAVAALDPRPDTVEDVLNVCPQQASSFGGRHLRLAWFHSPSAHAQGWPGREGVARVRVDTALRPQDPAVLIVAGVPSATARDPVIELEACAIPSHFVQPWATVEVVRDAADGSGDPIDTTSRGTLLRPESTHEILLGSIVRTSGMVHLLASPTDRSCRGVRLHCRRALKLCVPPRAAYVKAESNDRAAQGDNASSSFVESCPDASRRAAKGSDATPTTGSLRGEHRSERARGEGARSSNNRKGETGRHDRRAQEERRSDDDNGRRGNGQSARRGGCDDERRGEPLSESGARREEVRDRGRPWAEEISPEMTIVGKMEEGQVSERRGRGRWEKEGKGKSGNVERDWASRLRDWGVVTMTTKVVVPSSALEVWYHDNAKDTGGLFSTEDSEELSSWVDSVLRSHEPTVVQDLSASLELTAPTTTGSISTLAVRDDNRVKGIKAEGDKRGSGTKEGITMVWDSVASGDHAGRGSFNRGGSGAVLVHGPAGVGKTCLVEALAARLRCRLVKVSPGRLAAAAGINADRVLADAFSYCRHCVSNRVLLLLDSIDRLTPASDGGVGASRGEVDAGVLNTLVLTVEQGRGKPQWEDRVAMVFVTSWPDNVHPTARRCAGREVVVLPPSQPLRTEILKRAMESVRAKGCCRSATEATVDSDLEEAISDVAGLCQGFTAGDMCAIAAFAIERSTATDPSTSEALRAAFRQVRMRVVAGKGGAGGRGGGGGASVAGVPSVSWSEVGGLERAKRAVQEMVVWPARHPGAFSRMGITPASGVLLFGPPGTGKTLLAKAAATETGATFIELKISDVVRGEIGESEKAIDRAFRTARELAPSIVFIDEFQALFASRDAEGTTGSRLASQLLLCMDDLARWRSVGFGEDGELHEEKAFADGEGAGTGSYGQGTGGAASTTNVMVLAATNAPEAVDAAFLRPGRFDEIVYAGLPDSEGRRHILQSHKARMENANRTRSDKSASGSGNEVDTRDPDGGGGRWSSDVDLEWLSQETKDYSGADLSSLVRNAAMAALRGRVLFVTRGENGLNGVDGASGADDFELELELTRKNFEAALESTSPSSSAETIARHECWARQWHVG